MKKIILTKAQLIEYIERKKEDKVFYNILENLYVNVKLLNENISRKKVNQSVIDDYDRKNLITPRINEMLIKHKIINEKREII